MGAVHRCKFVPTRLLLCLPLELKLMGQKRPNIARKQQQKSESAGLKNVYMYWPLLVATLVTKFMTFIVVHKPAQMHGGALPEALHFWELHQSRSKR